MPSYAPYSHSRMMTHHKCPARFKYDYIDRLPAVQGLPGSPAMERGTLIHKSIEDFVLGKAPMLHPDIHQNYGQFFLGLKENYQVFPEHPFAFDVDFNLLTEQDAPNVWFRGYLDLKLVPRAGDDGDLIIYEFKTGKVYEIEHMLQRTRYGLVGLLQHPEVRRVQVHTMYLDLVDNRSTTYAIAHLEEHKRALKSQVGIIENDKFFMQKPSYTCRFCPRSRYVGGPCQF